MFDFKSFTQKMNDNSFLFKIKLDFLSRASILKIK